MKKRSNKSKRRLKKARKIASNQRIPVMDVQQKEDVRSTIEVKPVLEFSEQDMDSVLDDHDETTLANAKMLWFFGEWQQLATLDMGALRSHPDRDRFALLVASANQQLGDHDNARKYSRVALEWGCPPRVVAQILIAGVHNTLGRAAALQQDKRRILRHFEASVAINDSRDTALISHARSAREMVRLGLLSQASSLIVDDSTYTHTANVSAHYGAKITEISKVINKNVMHWSVNRRGYNDYVPRSPVGVGSTEVSRDNRIVICTHHKAGTNFLVKTFNAISKEFGYPIWMKFYDPLDEPEDWKICIEQHSRVSDITSNYNISGVHVVRHPRALILSAALYHMKCKEPWVDVPLQEFSGSTFWAATHGPLYNIIKNPNTAMAKKEAIMNSDYTSEMPSNLRGFLCKYPLDGKTYREYLMQLPTLEDRVMFEMNAYSGCVISDMLSFPSDKRFYAANIESLSFDSSMIFLREVFVHLGFNGEKLNVCLDIAKSNCIWKAGSNVSGSHGTTGMSETWKEVFQGKVMDEYSSLFGTVEESLGYS